MNPNLVILFGFLAAVLAVGGVYSLVSDLFLRDRSRVSKRIDEEFRLRQREQVQKSTLFGDLALLPEAVGGEEQSGLRRRFETLVAQSGLNLEPRRLLAIMAGVALALGAFTVLIRQNLAAGVVAALVGGPLPLLYVVRKRKARMTKLLAQLPDALELMARIIRSGQTMAQSLQAVADEFDLPIAAEFNYCYEQQNLGLSPETSLRNLAQRTGLLEIRIFVLAVLVQQQSGGNLAELLDKLAEVTRERFRIRGKIRALTAEGRMQAMVLLMLPPALLAILAVINRSYTAVLFQHSHLLVGVLVSELIGALWIRKIVNFDF